MTKKARERCWSLSKKVKEEDWQYDLEWYKNLREDEIQKLVEHIKRYYRMEKSSIS